ncbi:MAG: gliding motility-associated C-terminal domain-containing protein [Bacteroidota bacterium]|nr:gliding motility-associated C-terminal domain-containing protein [Bacteroidota bacterium]
MGYFSRYILIIVLLISCEKIKCQSNFTLKKINSTASEYGYKVVYDPTDNSIVGLNEVNTYAAFFSSACKYQLIKFDTCLNIIWKKDVVQGGQGQYGGLTYYNGTYSIYTSVNFQPGSWGVSILTFNQLGTIVSTSPIIYTGSSSINSGVLAARRLPNGDHLLTGSTTKNSSTYRFWFLKVDLANNVLWSNINSPSASPSWEGGSGADANAAGECFFTGRAYSTNLPVNDDIHVIKTDANGNVIWAKNYGTNVLEMGLACLATNDGGCIILSATSNSPNQTTAMRLDAFGNIVWSKLYASLFGVGINNESVCYLPNGNILVSGNYNNSASQSDLLLFEVNPNNGIIIKQRKMNVGSGNNSLTNIVINGSNIFAVGYTTPSSNNFDFLILKSNTSQLFDSTAGCTVSTPTISVTNYNASIKNGDFTISNYSIGVSPALTVTNSIPNTVLLCGTKPIAQFNLPSNLCLNKCITLKDSSQNKPSSWQWTINGPNTFSTINTPTISNFCFNNVGVYTIKLVVDNCVAKDSLTKSIFIIGPTMVPIVTSSPSCVGGTLCLTAPIAVTYTWAGPNNFATNTQTVYFEPLSYNLNGTYSLTSTLLNGCLNVGLANIIVNPLNTFTPSINGLGCINSNLQLTANTAANTYTWFGPNNYLSYSQNPTINAIQNNAAGVYTLIVTNNFGCSSFGTTSVSVYQNPSVVCDSVINNCEPYCFQSSVYSNSTLKDISWYLNGNSISTNQTQVKYCINKAGNYNLGVTISNLFGCINSYSTSFQVYPKPKVDFAFSPAYPTYIIPSVLLLGDVSNAAINSWQWQIKDTLSTTLFNTQNINYSFENIGNYYVTLKGISDKGCIDSVHKAVIIENESDIYIPNTFTPNDDGLNEVFKPIADGLTFYELFIYNRWGELLFTSKSIDDGWNGNYKNLNGIELKSDTYTYQINYKKNTPKLFSKTGLVYLLR